MAENIKSEMYTSDSGIKMLHANEALRLTAYQDSRGIWTIGWGHTPAQKGQMCTLQEATAWYAADLKWAEATVNVDVNVPMSQNEFDALVSLVFNIGCHHFEGSTVRIMLNAGLRVEAADAFLLWDKEMHDGQLVLSPGLLKRRQRERALFLTPVEVPL